MSAEAAQPYRRPPITEAVIEIRFAAPLPSATILKAEAALAAIYPHARRVKRGNVHVRVEETATAEITEEEGHQRSSADETEILVLWRTNFIISQLGHVVNYCKAARNASPGAE